MENGRMVRIGFCHTRAQQSTTLQKIFHFNWMPEGSSRELILCSNSWMGWLTKRVDRRQERREDIVRITKHIHTTLENCYATPNRIRLIWKLLSVVLLIHRKAVLVSLSHPSSILYPLSIHILAIILHCPSCRHKIPIKLTTQFIYIYTFISNNSNNLDIFSVFYFFLVFLWISFTRFDCNLKDLQGYKCMNRE